MKRRNRSRIVGTKLLENAQHGQMQSYLTVRELWTTLYSLVLSGHGDDQIRVNANGGLVEDNPALLGVTREDGEVEVWISDTEDAL